MRLLVLGGTHFLGWHVATAALARGHDVATFTRGVSGEPPDGVRALHGDRNDPDALPAALDGWTPDLVVDTSCQTRAGAPATPPPCSADVRGYAFVSSLNAYANWPPGPIGREDDEPTWTTDDDEYGPNKAYAEREIGAAVGGRFLTARAGLIVGPHDPIYRLGWWLDRIAAGRPRRRPGGPRPAHRPGRRPGSRRAGWSRWPSRAAAGGVNATGPVGMTTLGGLLEICREVTGSDAELVPVPEEELLDAGVEPWVHLPLWLPADIAPTAWDVDTTRARELGLASRPVSIGRRHVGVEAGEPAAARAVDRPEPGLPPELEAKLLAAR